MVKNISTSILFSITLNNNYNERPCELLLSEVGWDEFFFIRITFDSMYLWNCANDKIGIS